MPIKAAQANLSVFYRLELSNGSTYVIMATPLSVRIGQDILNVFNEQYTLITLLAPPGRSYPFLRNTSTNNAFVHSKLGIPGDAADLLTYLMPLLTTFPPGDELLDLAEQWVHL